MLMSENSVRAGKEHHKDGENAGGDELPMAVADNSSHAAFSLDQIANVLTDGYWARIGASRRAFDVEQEQITVDLSGLALEGWTLARTALNAWTSVTGISFTQVARPATSPGYETGDAGADPSSTIAFGMNQHILGNLTSSNDQDWYETTLVAGQTYLAKLTGTGQPGDLADPLLRLRDSSGIILAVNDQADGNDSVIEFTPTQTGRYIFEADGYLSHSGAYYLTVTNAEAAQIAFGDSDRGAYSTSDVMGGTITRSFVNVATDWLATSGTSIDSYSFQTYIHEIGHALGLGHAGFYNGSGRYPQDSHYDNDSWQASVMSYFSQTDNTTVDADYAYVVTPMAADIVAIQSLYGGPVSMNVGDTVYGANSNVGGYLGQLSAAIFNGVNVGSAYAGQATTMTIADTQGLDTFDASTATVEQTIDLRAEGVSSVMGVRGNVVIARGTVIENATGGSGNDTIYGNAASNVLNGGDGVDALRGGNGNDFLFGGKGADILDGGTGIDTVDYSDATSRVNLNLRSNAGTAGNALGDTLISIENVNASDFSDYVYGDDENNLINGGRGDDRLRGHNGNDTLIGGSGADELFGGSGVDTASYSTALSRVSVNLRKDAGTSGDARGDIFKSVENVVASDHSDYVYGNSANNVIDGGAGSDRLRGHNGNDTLIGGAGSDEILGGSGSDTVSYATAASRVNVNLRNNAGIAGDAKGDTFASIENVQASNYNDYVYGDQSDNLIYGEDGDDRLRGHGGNDKLFGGDGEDMLYAGSGVDELYGGADADVFEFRGNNSSNTVYDYEDGLDRILITGRFSFDDLTISASGTDTQVAFSSSIIFLARVEITAITEADFIFL